MTAELNRYKYIDTMAAVTPRTPMTSARKLFPRSPSSDCESDNSLGHMSPLSSPDRYSSPPCTPERLLASPTNGIRRSPRNLVRTSPRNSQFELLKLSSETATLSSLFLHRDVRRLRKHVDLNNTSELDKSFPASVDVENEKTPSKLPTNTVIPQTPSQKKPSNFGVIEESPITPSVSQSTETTGNVRKSGLISSGDEPAIPASMFYSKPSLTRELFPAPESSTGAKPTKQGSVSAVMKVHKRYTSVDSLHSINSMRSIRSRSSSSSMRRKSRRMLGEINAGVFHKLRRPKPKKLPFNLAAAYKIPKVMPRSKAEAYLKSAGLPADLTWLGQQVAQDTGNTPAAAETPRKQGEGQGRKRKLPDPPTPPPDPSKKFFKTNRTVHKTKTVTFDGNIKIRVAEGKFTLNRPENPLKMRTRKVLKFKTKGGAKTDPLFEAIDDEKIEQVNSNVRQLLEDWSDEREAVQKDLNAAVAAGGIVIASLPEEGTRTDAESSRMETSDEVVPGTPQKEHIIGEYMVGANGEIASPGLSFITSSLAISEDNLVSDSAVESGGSQAAPLVGTVVENLTDSSGLQRVSSQEPGEYPTSEGTIAAEKIPMSNGAVTEPTLELCENENFNEPEKENSCKKYFPLFYKSPEGWKKALSDTTNTKSPSSGRKLPWRFSRNNDQYQIDAGQKRLGATQCSVCGLVYSEGDMEDELAHLNYHNSTEALKFMGWKQERVVATHGKGRILVVHPGDPKSWWKRVSDVVEVVDKDLGYADGGSGLNIQGCKVYLYVESKSVIGCLVAQPITMAHRLQVTDGLDTCSQELYPVRCGVSRLWVVVSHRRRGIATKLVDCMRANFMYGYILSIEEFAFSVPTVSGKEFGTNYTKKTNFLVYM